MNLKLLKNRDFFLLMQGSFVSLIGSQMQTFALSLYVLNVYKSTGLFASILIASAIPRLILGPFAGVLVDWMDRKRIIVKLDFLSGFVVALFTFFYFSYGDLPLWSIYIMVISLSLISLIFEPAIETMMPSILKKDDLFEGNAIKNIVTRSSSIIAPLLAGALMGLSSFGIILLVNSASFILSAFSEMFIKLKIVNHTTSDISIKRFRNDFKNGIKFIGNNEFIKGLLIFAFLANFTIGPMFSIGLPHIIKRELLFTDTEFGIFSSVLTAASLLAGVIAIKLKDKIRPKTIIRTSIISQPAIMGLFGLIVLPVITSLAHFRYGIYIAMILSSFALITLISLSNIAINTRFQKEVPNEMLGRVSTVSSSISMATIPLGQALFGLLLDHYFAAYVLIGASIFGFLTLHLYLGRVSNEIEELEEGKVV